MSDSDDSGDDIGDYERVKKTAEFRFDFDGMSNEEDDFTSNSDNDNSIIDEILQSINYDEDKIQKEIDARKKEIDARKKRRQRREIMKERRQNKNMIKLYKFFYYFQRLRLHFADKVFVRENRRNSDPLQIAVTDLDAEVYNQKDKDTYARDFAYSTSGSNFKPDQELQDHIQKCRNTILADLKKYKAYQLKDSFNNALNEADDIKKYKDIFKELKLTNPVYNGTELKYVPVSSMKKRKGYSVRNNGEKGGKKKRMNGKFELIEQFNLSLKF